MTEEEASGQVDGPPISNSRDRKGNGGAFYQYCRQHGLWPKAVSGWDPDTESKRFVPYMPIRNVTKEFPPTLHIHGTNDMGVPYEQSLMMAEALKKHGVDHELVTIPGGEHGLGGSDPELVDSAYASTLEFVNRHMKSEWRSDLACPMLSLRRGRDVWRFVAFMPLNPLKNKVVAKSCNSLCVVRVILACLERVASVSLGF